jgi:hypothetical protein
MATQKVVLTLVFMMMSRNVMREHTQLIMESHFEYAHINYRDSK